MYLSKRQDPTLHPAVMSALSCNAHHPPSTPELIPCRVCRQAAQAAAGAQVLQLMIFHLHAVLLRKDEKQAAVLLFFHTA